jgi:hypothetical protein
MTRRYLTAAAYTCLTIIAGFLTGVAMVGLLRLLEAVK